MTEVDKDLWCAVVANDADAVRRAIASGADCESRAGELYIQTNISLMWAMEEKHGPEAIAQGHPLWNSLRRDLEAPPREREDFREGTQNPLVAASHYGFTEAAFALLEAGANPNSTSSSGLTPLLIAVRQGKSALAERLLQASADPNQAMPYIRYQTQGHSPLVRAAGDGNLTLVKLLLHYGADINGRDGAGRTALLAACTRPASILSWNDLFETPESPSSDATISFSWPTESASTSIEDMIYASDDSGDWDAIIELLLERGADIEAEAPPSSSSDPVYFEVAGTPLMAAVKRSDIALVRKLLTHGAVPRPACGTTPLHLAAQSGKSAELTQALLEAGADINEKDQEGASAVGQAARVGNLAVLQTLVGAGEGLLRRHPEFHTTLLHVAAAAPHIEVVRYLLDAGLDVNAKCVLFSLAEKQAKAKQFLAELHHMAQEANIAVPALPAVTEGSNERPVGVTPLMLAAEASKPAVVALLLERGADATLRDSLGWTARDYALRTEARQQRQQAMLAAQPAPIEDADIQKSIAKMPDEDSRRNLTQTLETMQNSFGGMFEKLFDDRRVACKETLALLPA